MTTYNQAVYNGLAGPNKTSKEKVMKDLQVQTGEFTQFIDYCASFYLPEYPDVLYPIDGLTTQELVKAILKYLDSCESSVMEWGDGDSVDRERVRDIIINERARAMVLKEQQKKAALLFSKRRKQ